ncbi:thiamine pyrophosphokinase [Syncephalis fuscata]|nr:thiamine pyrophosphokinase [Syncephalis fuscata]
MTGSAAKDASWHFTQYLSKNSTTDRYALVILNQPLKTRYLDLLWKRATIRLCADGGANRLYEAIQSGLIESSSIQHPEYICGDMDSAKPSVVDHFLQKGSIIEKSSNQDTTDFQKCITALEAVEKDLSNSDHTITSPMPIIALGGLGGRFDQAMHSIHILYQSLEQQRRIYLMTEESVAFILDKGQHTIQVDSTIEGPTCGLLPIGNSKVRLTTHGLQWDLDDADTSFGRLLSTSNAFKDKIISISTNAPIVWTAELRIV